MKYVKVVIILLMLSFLILPGNSGNASEPSKPDVMKDFEPEKEAKIDSVMNLAPEEAFDRLKEDDVIFNEDLLHKAIYRTFGNRRAKGVDLALRHMTVPQRETINGKFVSRAEDFYVAKNILEVFPDESVGRLLQLYKKGNPVVKSNVISASGKIGGKAIRNLLVKALNDKTFCEEETPEIDGYPLRICDVAYNQLVLRYKVENVLRTIGNVYTIEVRDYHINILKTRLKESDY